MGHIDFSRHFTRLFRGDIRKAMGEKQSFQQRDSVVMGLITRWVKFGDGYRRSGHFVNFYYAKRWAHGTMSSLRGIRWWQTYYTTLACSALPTMSGMINVPWR